MIDPWTALGLASAITQFVDFGLKVVSYSRETLNEGFSHEHAQFQKVTLDLKAITVTLSGHPFAQQSDKLTGEKALQDLNEECQREAQSLLQLFESIRSKQQTKLSSFKAALLAIWKKEDIGALERRLSVYREQLTLRLLVVLNASSNQQHDTIVEVLTLSRSIKDSLESESISSQQKHQETTTAILKLQNGETRTIFRPTKRLPITISRHHQSVLYSAETGLATSEASAGYSKYTYDLQEMNRRVLSALFFREISFREESIDVPFGDTFQWIFQDHIPEGGRNRNGGGNNDTTSDMPLNFLKWLQEGKGCYWINGKAGSGKSTLMNYIDARRETYGALLRWAEPQQLFSSSFYFWNSGTSIQKSQEGLFRSILFALLDKYPNLIPILFPKFFRAITLKPDEDLSLTFNELKQAISNLDAIQESGLKICLFIDGLDEYVGDHIALSEQLVSISQNDSLKIIVSSRPIPACVQVFSDCPSIRLQDLTYQDIDEYVSKKLVEHKLMIEMEAREPGSNKIFVSEIIEKASGVFLWVVLVVKSLLEGLHNYDKLADLLHRLYQIPSDLERLYEHLLNSMSPTYQRESAIILLAFLRNSEINSAIEIPALQMYHISEYIVQEVFDMPVLTPGQKTLAQQQIQVTEGRLRSRCCGLLEVNRRFVNDAQVTALHRTVRDFLNQDAMRQRLLGIIDCSKTDIDQTLLASHIAMLKCKHFTTQQKDRMDNTTVGLVYAESLNFGETVIPRRLLDEMEIVMGKDYWQDDFYAFPAWAPEGMPRSWPYRVAMHGLGSYVNYRCDTEHSISAQHVKTQMLVYLLLFLTSSKYEEDEAARRLFPNIHYSVIALLRGGADIGMLVQVGSPGAQVCKEGPRLNYQGCIKPSVILSRMLEHLRPWEYPYSDWIVDVIEAILPSRNMDEYNRIKRSLSDLKQNSGRSNGRGKFVTIKKGFCPPASQTKFTGLPEISHHMDFPSRPEPFSELLPSPLAKKKRMFSKVSQRLARSK